MHKNDRAMQEKLLNLLQGSPVVRDIIHKIHLCQGRTLLVGGAVRDLLMGLPVKDLDIEVHGVSLQGLQDILQFFGPVSLVGKSFGVLRLHGLDVDWSLPRADSCGRKPEVTIDPTMSIEQAFLRRDLTINAMGIDLITFQLLDPYGGKRDLEQKILRATNPEFFVQDPLRFFRVMQFVGRFEMVPDDLLQQVCATMSLKGISVERIEGEFYKLFLKSAQPARGLRWLHNVGRLRELFPELAVLVDVQQNPAWHPEGDVFEHTMQAVDASAQLTYADEIQKLQVMFAALCHDLGKAVSTRMIDGVLRSHGHEETGVALTQALLKRITRNQTLIEVVKKLVRYHMAPGQFVKECAKPPAYKRLARKLAPETTLQVLALLATADKRGRNPQRGGPLSSALPDIQEFVLKAEQAEVLHAIEEPVLQGKDIMDVVQPGPRMGMVLQQAYEIQINEGIKDKEELKRRILSYHIN